MSTRRQTLRESLKKDAIALGICLALGLAYMAHNSPLEVSLGDPTASGTAPPSPTHPCDTLLVTVDPPLPEEEVPTTFSTLDMGWGWYSILSQEVGCFKHTALSDISSTTFSTMRLVVVPASAARAMRSEHIDSLRRWMEQGGLLLVEQPDPRWNSATGVPISAAPHRITRRITAASGSTLRGALRDALVASPLTTTMVTAELSTDAKGRMPQNVLMEVDGRPAFVHASRGDGHAYVLTIDMARAVMTLQQGRPLDDFSLPATEEEYIPGDMTQPWVMVADKKMLNNDVPYADLLERMVIEPTASHIPLPRWWYFPDKYAGVFIMSHDEEAFGDKSLFMTDWEDAHGHVSSNFIIPDSMSPEGLRKMIDQGHDVQVHWNRGFYDVMQTRPFGLPFWAPIALEMDMEAQRMAIEEHLDDRAVTLNRVHGLVWDQDWSLSFQKMAAARIAADSTYGPTGPKQFGYLFGTGRPFYPLDHQGQLLPVQEIPFVMQDDENLDLKRLRRLLTRSAGGHHQIIMPIFHTNTMANRPNVEVFDAWRKLFALAKRNEHWVTTMRDFLLFEEARRTSSMRSRFIKSEQRLEINVEIQPPRITMLPPLPGQKPTPTPLPSVAFPQKYKGNNVEEVSIDGAKVKTRFLGRSGDGFYHVLKVPAGKHNIHVIYAGRVIEAITPEE